MSKATRDPGWYVVSMDDIHGVGLRRWDGAWMFGAAGCDEHMTSHEHEYDISSVPLSFDQMTQAMFDELGADSTKPDTSERPGTRQDGPYAVTRIDNGHTSVWIHFNGTWYTSGGIPLDGDYADGHDKGSSPLQPVNMPYRAMNTAGTIMCALSEADSKGESE